MIRNACTPPAPMSENFEFAPWILTSVKSHILPSKCPKGSCMEDDKEPCKICCYSRSLTLPHLPDMVFPENVLRIQHPNGTGLEFNALDALKLVNPNQDLIKVAIADAWQESR